MPRALALLNRAIDRHDNECIIALLYPGLDKVETYDNLRLTLIKQLHDERNKSHIQKYHHDISKRDKQTSNAKHKATEYMGHKPMSLAQAFSKISNEIKMDRLKALDSQQEISFAEFRKF